jgi:hypothetical protein
MQHERKSRRANGPGNDAGPLEFVCCFVCYRDNSSISRHGTSYGSALTQPKKRENGHNHYNKPDQINDPVHYQHLLSLNPKACVLTNKQRNQLNVPRALGNAPKDAATSCRKRPSAGVICTRSSILSFEPAPVLSIVSSERTFASSRRAIGMESEISIRHGRIINFDQACAVYCGQPKKTKNNF